MVVLVVVARDSRTRTVRAESAINFSVKRRMRPVLPANAGWNSLDAFILRFVGTEGFFVFTTAVRARILRPALVSQP